MSGHFEFPSMHEDMGSVGSSETILLGNISTTCACTGRCKMPPYTCSGQPLASGPVIVPTGWLPDDRFALPQPERWQQVVTIQPSVFQCKPRIRVKAGSRKLPA